MKAKKLLSLFLSLCLIFSFACIASAKGTALEDYYYQNGSYSVISEEFKSGEKTFSHYKIFFPSELDTSGKTYPVVIYSNGTGANYKETFEKKLLEFIASWGYIVVANDDASSGMGYSASKGLDFLLALNKDPSSTFYKSVNKKQIAAAGHSQGGTASLNVASIGMYDNSSMFKTVFAASAPQSSIAASFLQNTPYDASKIKASAFLISGTGSIDSGNCPLEAGLKANALSIQNENVVIARRKNADHGQMLYIGKAYMMAWFEYALKGDKQAAEIFEGDDAELFSNPNWQDAQKKSSIISGDSDEKPSKTLIEMIKDYINGIFDRLRSFLRELSNILK